MQPADVIAADMFAAISRALAGDTDQGDPGGANVQLLLAAAFQRDEPEGGGLDAVPACRQKPVVLVQRGFHTLEGLGNVRTRVVFHSDLSAQFTDDDVILEECAGVLCDRIDGTTCGEPRSNIGDVRMSHCDDVRVLFMNIGVQDETRAVHGIIAFDQFAFMIHKDQVRQLHLVEKHAHRVGPVQLRTLRVSHDQVPGKTIVETLLSEGKTGGDQPLLAVLAFGFDGLELGQFRKNKSILF